MESSTQKRALGLKDKIPDIQKTLDTVQFLKSRDVRPLVFPFLDSLSERKEKKNLCMLTYNPAPGRRRAARNILRAE